MRPFFLLALILLSVSAQALSPQEIVRRSDDLRGPDGTFSFKVKVEDLQQGRVVKENVYKVYSKDSKYTLIESIFPERLTGRKLLMAGALWLYLPSLRRPTRVGLQQRLTGEVANGDIARVSFHQDYRAKIEGKEKIGGKAYTRLKLVAKDDSAPYRKVRLWVEERSFAPLKAEFFALSGKKLKTSTYSEYENVLGKQRLTRVVIQDAVQPSRKSHLKFYDYRRETLDAKFFNKDNLGD